MRFKHRAFPPGAMAFVVEQFGELMTKLKGVISKDSGQEAWCERINLISQAVSVIGEDYVTQLKDGGVVDTKIDASQVNMSMLNTDLNARVNVLEGDASSKAFLVQTVESELQAIK